MELVYEVSYTVIYPVLLAVEDPYHKQRVL